MSKRYIHVLQAGQPQKRRDAGISQQADPASGKAGQAEETKGSVEVGRACSSPSLAQRNYFLITVLVFSERLKGEFN